MQKIAFLGLGAMGSRMAKNLLDAGYPLTVWNRSKAATEAFAKVGATVADSPAEAAKEADVVMVMVRDDDASMEVWSAPEHGAFNGMKQGAIAVDSSTLSVAGVKKLADVAKQRGIALLEAPVSGTRKPAENAQLVYLVGGDKAAFDKVEPLFRANAKSSEYVGDIGSGALAKLATNAMLGIQATAFAELIGMLKHNGVDVEQTLKAVSATTVWAPIANYLTSTMVEQNFAPQFSVELVEKDFRYVEQAAGADMPVSKAARAVFRKAMEQGFGGENLTAVAKLYQK